jgi:hypothetical protein
MAALKKICHRNMSVDDCEMEIMKENVKEMSVRVGREKVNSHEIRTIFNIIERFLRSTEVICYGGTAINNILPKEDQFYNRDYELPDYDFFSYEAVEIAEMLADIYANSGFTDVVAQAGIHYGTYKVFVNFIPIADITYIPKELFMNLKKSAIVRNGIYYTPPDYLRMSMYLELSRPRGDISRWEKVLTRLNLLNKHYPMEHADCNHAKLQELFEPQKVIDKEKKQLYTIIRDFCEDNQGIFFGAFAFRQYYLQSLSKRQQREAMSHNELRMVPDFDVLMLGAKEKAEELKNLLGTEYTVSLKSKKPYIDLLEDRYTIEVAGKPVITFYEPMACHSYHKLEYGNGRHTLIASMDTILSIYLLFLFINDIDREKLKSIECMAYYLFTIMHTRRLLQRGVFQRFTLECYGNQTTLEGLRSKKMEMYKKLYKYKNSDVSSKKYHEYREWFLKYIPTISNREKEIDKTTRPNTRSVSKSNIQKRYTMVI